MISCVRILNDYEWNKSGVRFESVTLPATTALCGGKWGTMSQISILFGMPLMVVLATELTNCGDTSKDLDDVRECLSLLPLSARNRVVKLLLIYMGNHWQSVDEDFGTIPERCVGRCASMLFFQSSHVANVYAETDSTLSKDMSLSYAKI